MLKSAYFVDLGGGRPFTAPVWALCVVLEEPLSILPSVVLVGLFFESSVMMVSFGLGKVRKIY